MCWEFFDFFSLMILKSFIQFKVTFEKTHKIYLRNPIFFQRINLFRNSSGVT
jgi:hypothetical protein